MKEYSIHEQPGQTDRLSHHRPVALGIVIVLIPVLIAVGIVLMILQSFFGVKVAKFQWGNFQSRKRPAPSPDPEPEVPASEAVIDAEVVDLPDEPAARLKDDER